MDLSLRYLDKIDISMVPPMFVAFICVFWWGGAGVHGASFSLRRRVAVRADPRALETLVVSAYPGLPGAVAHARVGAGRTLALHLRGAPVVVAYPRPHRSDRVGVHDGTSPLTPVVTRFGCFVLFLCVRRDVVVFRRMRFFIGVEMYDFV